MMERHAAKAPTERWIVAWTVKKHVVMASAFQTVLSAAAMIAAMATTTNFVAWDLTATKNAAMRDRFVATEYVRLLEANVAKTAFRSTTALSIRVVAHWATVNSIVALKVTDAVKKDASQIASDAVSRTAVHPSRPAAISSVGLRACAVQVILNSFARPTRLVAATGNVAPPVRLAAEGHV